MGSLVTPKKTVLTAGDLYDRSEDSFHTWFGDDLTPATKVIKGSNDHIKLRDGLGIHYSDTEELNDLVIETDMSEHIGVRIILEGNIDARLGDQSIPMPKRSPDRGTWKPIASIYSQVRQERFHRKLRKGDRVKKVIVTFKRDWLFEQSMASGKDYEALKKFTDCHLACQSWHPSQSALTCAEQILNPPSQSDFLKRLYMESRALHLIVEAFQQVLNPKVEQRQSGMRQQDRQRLERLEAYLEAYRTQSLQTKGLADAAGVSVNTLQRLCQSVHGTSVSDYVRRWRLNKARYALEFDGISIAEAAYIAGYGSPANFSTAFKRHFGISPSEVTVGW